MVLLVSAQTLQLNPYQYPLNLSNYFLKLLVSLDPVDLMWDIDEINAI